MNQTIAQQIKWDFEANGSLEIKNKNRKRIYLENSDGFWSKMEYDSKGKLIYCDNSNGFWSKYEYDSKGNQIYHENSGGYWERKEHNSEGNEIYFENSNGIIIDNRPKPCEDKVIEIDGIKYKLTKL